MKKIILLLLTCLALAISSCGKSGGDDEGKGGGGDGPDGTQTNLKRVLKFNADSDVLKVQSIDFGSQQAVPIALDVPAIKEATAKYKVTIKARVLASRRFAKGSELPADKIIYSFERRGGDHYFSLEKGGKDSTQLFYQINNTVGDYLVLKIEFYVSYKNGSENQQDEVNPVALIADRKIEIQDKLDPHIFLHREMGKQQSFKVQYASSIPADVLKELSYVDKANYTVELAPDSSATAILTPKLEFRVPGAAESEVQFIPSEDRTMAFSDINVTRDNVAAQSDSYRFYRCGDDQNEELYFIKPGGNSRIFEITAPISPTPTPKRPEDLTSNLAMFVSNIIACNSGSKLDMTFGAGGSNSAVFKVPGNQSVEIGDKSWSTWTSPALDYGRELWMALLDSPTPTPKQVVAFLRLNGNNEHKATINITNKAETAILKWGIKREEKERHIALLQGNTKELNIKVDYMPETAKASGRKIQLKINDIWKDDGHGNSTCVLLFNAVESPPYVTTVDHKERTKCSHDGFIVYVRDDVAKDILIKASAQSISGTPQDITINTPKCEDPDTCQVASFDDEKMPVKISVDNTKACYYPMFTYESDGMIRDTTKSSLNDDKSCYQSPRSPSTIPSLIMPGSTKHFIVEVSSVKDSSMDSATMTTFYLHAISFIKKSDTVIEERDIADSANVKMYKLTLVDADNKQGGGNGRDIIGLKQCAISSVLATDSVPQCQTNPSGENRQFFLVEDSRSKRDEGDGYDTIGIRVFPSGDEASYIKTPKNLWAYKEAAAADIKPNITFKGFQGDGDNNGKGWRLCQLHALRHGVGGMFDYDQEYGSSINRICPTIYKPGVGTSNITPIAINMTNLEYKGSCNGNIAKVFPGEWLSVMYTDFADLKVNYSGFDQDWSSYTIANQRQIVISNYSGQLKDKKFEETDYSADFTISLPVGDPDSEKRKCRDYDVYGTKTEGAPGRNSANLTLNIKKFDLTTGYTTTTGYDKNPRNASVVITTDLCGGIEAYGGKGGQECHADGIANVGNNFRLGICQKNDSDLKNPYEVCNVNDLI
jgi:hypothetical protein